MAETGMTRRRFLQSAAAGAAALTLSTGDLGAAEPERKPNVIVILSDDHGYGAMTCQNKNWDVPTPHMDAIAANGIRFTNGYVTCPICSPARAGLMTGRYPTRFGHEDNCGPAPDPKFGLPVSEKTMADYLKGQGYRTALVGKWHLGFTPERHPLKRGFDEFFGFLGGAHSYVNPRQGEPIVRGTQEVDEKEYLTDALTREAVSFIERHKREPFFLYLAFNAVHAPHEMPPKYKDKVDHIKGPLRKAWAAQLMNLDDAIGQVMAKVRSAGLEEDTLVFFLGDNGGYPLADVTPNAPLHGKKADTYEGGVRIPFLVQWKGKLPKGKVYDDIVLSLDILPTAMAAAGGKVAGNVEGVDLTPYLLGRNSGAPHDRVFWRLIEKHGARVGDWKLVQNGDGIEKLFNLADDIGEEHDLAGSSPEKLKELQAAYRQWNSRNVAPAWLDSRRKNTAGKTP